MNTKVELNNKSVGIHAIMRAGSANE